MAYTVELITAADAEFRKLEKGVQKRTAQKIEGLKENARPSGCKKLKGGKDLYRVRVGDYRIIYQISDSISLVLILKIGDRKDCYD